MRLAAVTCLRKPAAIRLQESRMSGNPLVRFDEGRVGRTLVSPSLLLYRDRFFRPSKHIFVSQKRQGRKGKTKTG